MSPSENWSACAGDHPPPAGAGAPDGVPVAGWGPLGDTETLERATTTPVLGVHLR